MYQLDGDIVVRGDTVHHTEWGTGRVVGVQDGAIAVQFGDADPVHFAHDGVRNGRKSLYWAPPLLIAPRKGDRPDQVASVKAIFDSVMTLVRGRNS